MKSKLVPLALILMALSFVYLRFTTFRPKLRDLRAGNAEIKVDIADTIGKQRKGLSGRDSLPKDQGMYFPMVEGPATYTFWMNNMRFPLDIIWIREGKIVDISQDVPHPVGDGAPARVQPSAPADAVLEVNADFTERYEIKIGDRVMLED